MESKKTGFENVPTPVSQNILRQGIDNAETLEDLRVFLNTYRDCTIGDEDEYTVAHLLKKIEQLHPEYQHTLSDVNEEFAQEIAVEGPGTSLKFRSYQEYPRVNTGAESVVLTESERGVFDAQQKRNNQFRRAQAIRESMAQQTIFERLSDLPDICGFSEKVSELIKKESDQSLIYIREKIDTIQSWEDFANIVSQIDTIDVFSFDQSKSISITSGELIAYFSEFGFWYQNEEITDDLRQRVNTVLMNTKLGLGDAFIRACNNRLERERVQLVEAGHDPEKIASFEALSLNNLEHLLQSLSANDMDKLPDGNPAEPAMSQQAVMARTIKSKDKPTQSPVNQRINSREIRPRKVSLRAFLEHQIVRKKIDMLRADPTSPFFNPDAPKLIKTQLLKIEK